MRSGITTTAMLVILAVGICLLPAPGQAAWQPSKVDWGLLMSGAVIVTIPAIVFFLVVQRFLIQGWGMGAVKG